MTTTHERRSNRSADERIQELETKIAGIRERDARKQVNADPGRKHARLGLAALRRAVTSTEDEALRVALQDLVPQVERCLGLESTITAKPRGKR